MYCFGPLRAVENVTKTLARPFVCEHVLCVYPEEYKFRNFALMIGKTAFMNAFSCRDTLAKNLFYCACL